ncbi:hypothetical protein D3C81_2137260 [compost metagenome]
MTAYFIDSRQQGRLFDFIQCRRFACGAAHHQTMYALIDQFVGDFLRGRQIDFAIFEWSNDRYPDTCKGSHCRFSLFSLC